MIDYYSKNYIEYHNKAFMIDPSFFLEPFVKRLDQNARILDIGCASGRDILWLIKRGFEAEGFERSNGLAELAQKNTSCKIIKGDFEIYDFSTLSYDAILASGSLVHLSHKKLPLVLKNIIKAIKEPINKDLKNNQTKAQLYISLKQGDNEYIDKYGRKFYPWKDCELRSVFSSLNISVIELIKSESAVGSGDIWLGYVCYVHPYL